MKIREIILDDIPKVSANRWNVMHWGGKTSIKNKFSERFQWQHTGFKQIMAIVETEYHFYLTGRLFDITNCFPMVKIVEDMIMLEDNPDNVKRVCITCNKSDTGKNYVKIIIKYL